MRSQWVTGVMEEERTTSGWVEVAGQVPEGSVAVAISGIFIVGIVVCCI